MNYKQLKIFAVLCMVFDHVTRIFPIVRFFFPLSDWLFARGMTGAADFVIDWLPLPFSFIGRLGAPIFLFCIVNGFFHTHDVKKYILRIAVTAVIAQLPYIWFDLAEYRLMNATRLWWEVGFNILFTLATGLIALALFDALRKRGHLLCAVLVAVAAAALCRLLRFEGKEGYILLMFTYYFLRGRTRPVQTAVFIPAVVLSRIRLLTLFWDGLSLSNVILNYTINVFGNYLGLLIPVWFYNGERGDTGRHFQLFMYAFYPAHLLVLAMIGYLRPPF